MENTLDLEAGRLLVERLESAAGMLERAVGGLSGLPGLPGLPGLEERQGSHGSAVERISATVEMSRREEELEARLAEAERELVELRAAAASGLGGSNLPNALQPLRKTLPSATAEMLSKHGIGETAVDVRALDAALVGLSLEQRIAVKSQLRRAGAMA